MNKSCTTFQKNNQNNSEGLPSHVFCLSLITDLHSAHHRWFIEICYSYKWYIQCDYICFVLPMLLFWCNETVFKYFIQYISQYCSPKVKAALGTWAAAIWKPSFLSFAVDMIQLYSVHFLLACCQKTSPILTPSSNLRECISLAQLISIDWALPFIPGHILGHWSSYSSVTLSLLCWHGPMSVSPSIHWFLQ